MRRTLAQFLLALILSAPNFVLGAPESKTGFDLYDEGMYSEALPMLLDLAEGNDPKAGGLVARIFTLGLQVEKDYVKGLLWANRAGQLGDALAQNLVGVIYLNGWGVTKDTHKSIDWFTKAAGQNFNLAMQNLGMLYAYGNGVPRDSIKALYWFEKAAQESNVYAKYMVYTLTRNSDKDKSIRYLRSSATLNYGDAQASLGDEYYYGGLVPQDYAEARRWYLQATKISSRFQAHSTYKLGWMSFWGEGRPKDVSEGLRLYRETAEFNKMNPTQSPTAIISALNELGRIYQNGIGVSEDPAQAFEYYQKSAALGDSTGQVQAAAHLLEGWGTSIDTPRAIDLLRLSARQNNFLARLQLLETSLNDEKSERQPSEIVKKITLLAENHKEKDIDGVLIRQIEQSDIVKEIDAYFRVPIRDENFTKVESVVQNGRELLKKLNLAVADAEAKPAKTSLESLNLHYLKMERLMLERKIGVGYFELVGLNPDETTKARHKTSDESFKNFLVELESSYSSDHPFHPQVLVLNGFYHSVGNKPGQRSNLKKVFEKIREPKFIARNLANSADQVTELTACKAYFDANNDPFEFGLFVDGAGDSNYSVEELEKVIHALENSLYCLTRDNFNKVRGGLRVTGLARQSNLSYSRSLLAYLYEGVEREEILGGIEKHSYIAGLLDNVTKKERIEKAYWGKKSKGQPSINLLHYYLRDGDFRNAEKALRIEIKASLDTGFLYDDHLASLAKLPRTPPRQKVFLLKEAVKINRELFTGLSALSELVGNHDFFNRANERELVRQLLKQKRNTEAELFIRFVKLKEISELLRDPKISTEFSRPEWFYTPEEQELNKMLQEKLVKAKEQYIKSGKPNYITGENIKHYSERLGDQLVDFLITGKTSAVQDRKKKASPKPLPDRFEAILKKLPPGTAILQFFVEANQLFINARFADSRVSKQITLESGEIEKLVYALRSSIVARKDIKIASNNLYTLLFKEIDLEFKKQGIKNIMLSLDGRLRYVPFSALWDGRGYLVEAYNFSILDDINDPRGRGTPAPKLTVAGFGVSKPIGGFSPLPSVKKELRQIVLNPSGGVYPGRIILDEEFTLRAFKAALSEKFPILHVATHFKFSPGTEMNSYLLMGDGHRLSLSQLDAISLDGVEVITYSGCQTGLGGGRDENGVEIAGLGYISRKNGAKTVISSLWSVSDESTSELMMKMYEKKTASKGRMAEALTSAKLGLLRSKEFSHPFYWAGFYVYGDEP